jgi:hypothetical protein
LEAKADAIQVKAHLTYWVVFGLFTILEPLADILLSWVPLYPVARVALQVWLFAKDFAGALLVYNTVVAPLVVQVEVVTDQVMKELSVLNQPANPTKVQ